MRSVRFDADLDRRVERAAKRRGITVSDFIRTAVRRECDAVLDTPGPEADWNAILRGSPNGEAWIKALDGIVGAVDEPLPDDNELDGWAKSIREHNWRV